MTTTTTMKEQDGRAVIATVTRLLETAADRCLTLLAADPPARLEASFALSDLGLGARLVAVEARSLLPDSFDLASPSPDQEDPLQLVRTAEALARSISIEVLPRGSSRVVAALCDLLREHR